MTSDWPTFGNVPVAIKGLPPCTESRHILGSAIEEINPLVTFGHLLRNESLVKGNV